MLSRACGAASESKMIAGIVHRCERKLPPLLIAPVSTTYHEADNASLHRKSMTQAGTELGAGHDAADELTERAAPKCSAASPAKGDLCRLRRCVEDTTARYPAPETVLVEWLGAGEPKVMVYKDLELVVKFNAQRVRVEEAIAMQFVVRQSLPPDQVPVPEVLGWYISGQYSLLYMSLAPGPTLMEAWPSLDSDEKNTICKQLGPIVVALRSLQQPEALPCICTRANGGPVRDRFLRWTEQSGGYDSVSQFHDFLSRVALPDTLPEKITDPWRGLFPDNCEVYFTHGDLTLSNIMVAGTHGSRRITSIIDWEQAGWYPEYWEYCKLHIGVDDRHEWRAAGWADRVMQNYEDEFYAIAEYWQCRPP